MQRRFEHGFETFRGGYHRLLETCMRRRLAFIASFLGFCVASLGVLLPWLGRDFFPAVDAGSFKLHVRAPTGMRIEDTADLCDHIENWIRTQIPAAEVSSVIDNIGL